MANKNTHSSLMNNHNNSIIILLLISLIQYSVSQTCCGCTTPMQECNDANCRFDICTNDHDIELSSCCTTSWEYQCAAKAQEICAPITTTIIPSISPASIPQGLCCSCTIETESSGCESDQECANTICAEDSLCCSVAGWDATCVDMATVICNGGTTLLPTTHLPTKRPTNGLTFSPIIPGSATKSPIPSPTSEPTSQPTIIIIPSSQPPIPLPTSSPSSPPTSLICCDCTTPFEICDDTACKFKVCVSPLSECCTVPATTWNTNCSAKAQEICPLSNITTTIIPSISPTYVPQGLCCSCTTPDKDPGCDSDPECADKICADDTHCCHFGWDEPCAKNATDICNNVDVTTLSPTTIQPTPPIITPTTDPTRNPLITSTAIPTQSPSFSKETRHPSQNPTIEPTTTTSFPPSNTPTDHPTITPTLEPTVIPPTDTPTTSPTTITPTIEPSQSPTQEPTTEPTTEPTFIIITTTVTSEPTLLPTPGPTIIIIPTSQSPTSEPTSEPTLLPTTGPTLIIIPTTQTPTPEPTTKQPTPLPTSSPSSSPIHLTCCDCTIKFETCGDTECLLFVCEPELTYCCDDPPDSWDETCAEKAQEICPLPNITTTIIPSISPTSIPKGLCCSCTTVHTDPGCDTDPECAEKICTEDTLCCSTSAAGWDSKCVAMANNTCNNATPLPTNEPTTNPIGNPSIDPTSYPTRNTTPQPTDAPIIPGSPTKSPSNTTPSPTDEPTPFPTHIIPTSNPTNNPTITITTSDPTEIPTSQPTKVPTPFPLSPAVIPTLEPTRSQPTPQPTTAQPTPEPTPQPTQIPTNQPTTAIPTITTTIIIPTFSPTLGLCCACTTSQTSPGCDADPECEAIICAIDPICCDSEWEWDSYCVTEAENICNNVTTISPTPFPTKTPTNKPTHIQPTSNPTPQPTNSPIIPGSPTKSPTNPTPYPTNNPTITPEPTPQPTKKPSYEPTPSPQMDPAKFPTQKPTSSPSYKPTPTYRPTTERPTFYPTVRPTLRPTNNPTVRQWWTRPDYGEGNCCDCMNPKKHARCAYDRKCEQMICTYDKTCCWSRWDEVCALKARAICENDDIPKCCSCTVMHREEGCKEDISCEKEICEVHPHCCTKYWDFTCIHHAVKICTEKSTESID